MTNYELRITDKGEYFTFEYESPVDNEWKEMISRETKEELIQMTIPFRDENNEIIIDELTNKPKTGLSPYFYEE